MSKALGKDATAAGEPGSALLGYNFDLVVLDDPMGAGFYPLAKHDKYVEQTRPWLRHLLTKIKPGGELVLFESRFAPDDATGILTGLLPTPPEKLVVPAMPKGESYWPEFCTVEQLDSSRRAMTQKQWSGLYMQEPVA
jgi:hypothetical protein